MGLLDLKQRRTKALTNLMNLSIYLDFGVLVIQQASENGNLI